MEAGDSSQAGSDVPPLTYLHTDGEVPHRFAEASMGFTAIPPDGVGALVLWGAPFAVAAVAAAAAAGGAGG